MSLDIGNITNNLKKVASATKSLGADMASSFDSARANMEALNNTIKQDVRDFGAMANVKAQIGTLGNELAAPFVKMGQSVKDTVGKSKSYLTDLYSSFKADSADFGFFNTLSAYTKTAFSSIGKSLTLGGTVELLKSKFTQLSTTIAAGFSRGNGIVRKFTSSAMQPLVSTVQSVQQKFDKFLNNLSGKLYTGNKAVRALNDEVKRTGVQFKDVARIVQGILISQVFYAGVNAIQRATSAVWEFASALEYSQIVYTNFFGSTDLAEGFIDVLKEFAAQTRFSFSELNAAAQQLVAYGFQAKNLMYVLRGVTAAASISGDTAKIESISRALGQIYTKGRLMSEEMRQLAEAGIPAYDILQEKLGLTYKQLQNLGDEAIPASTAINALIEGINERFGTLLDYSNMTITGLVGNIGDLGLQMAESIFAPVIGSIRKALISIAKGMQTAYEIINTSGIGGLFEHFIPPELQGIIRNIIASVLSLGMSIKSLISSVMNLGSALAPVFGTWLNIAVTVLAAFARMLATAAHFLTTNAKALSVLTKMLVLASAAWVLFKVHMAIAGVTASVIKGLQGMSRGLASLANGLVSLAQHPALLFLMTLIALILTLTGTLGKARDAMNSFLSSMNGSADKTILNPKKVDKSTASVDDYSHALDSAKDGLDGVGDSADDAKNKAKKLADALSFDEVFKLNLDENGDGNGDKDSVQSEWEKLLGDLAAGNADFSDIFEDIDFGDFASEFVGSLADALNLSLLKDFGKFFIDGFSSIEFNNMLLGALGAALSLAILGFSPAGLFLAVGMLLFGVFWDDIAKAFGAKADVDLGTLILGAVGAALAVAILGFTPAGLFVGLASLFVGAFWDDFVAAFGEDYDISLGELLMGAVVAAVALATLGFTPVGVFTAIGAILVAGFWSDLAEAFGLTEATISLSEVILAALGTALITVGTKLTGGKAIWAVATVALVASFWEELMDQFGLDWNIDLGSAISAAVIAAGVFSVKGLKSGLWTALVAALVLGFTDELEDKFGEARVQQQIGSAVAVGLASSITKLKKGNAGLQAALAGVGLMVVEGILTSLGKEFDKSDQEIQDSISSAVGGAIIGGVAAAFLGLPAGVLAAITAAAAGIVTLFKDEIDEFLSSDAVQTGMLFVWATALGAVLGGLPGALIGLIASTVYTIVYNFKDEIKAQFKKMTDSFTTDLKEIWAPVLECFKFDGKDLLEIGSNIVLGILEGINAVVGTIGSLLKSYLIDPIIDGIKDLFGIHSPATTMEPIGQYLVEGIFQGISDTITWLIEGIQGFVDDVVEGFSDWFSGTYESAKTWCNDMWTSISTWTSDTATNISTWVTNRKNDFTDWASNTKTTITTWVTDRTKDFSSWATDTKTSITTWASDTKTSISTWVTDRKEDFTSWASETGEKVSTWATDAATDITTWASETKTSVTTWVSDRKSDFKSWASDTGEKVSTWATTTKSSITTWASETKTSISTWVTDRKEDIKSWAETTGEKISKWAKDANTDIGKWVTDTKDSVTTWASETKKSFTTWSTDVGDTISTWATNGFSSISTFCSDALSSIGSWASDVASKVKSSLSNAWDAVGDLTGAADKAAKSVGDVVKDAKDKLDQVKEDTDKAKSSGSGSGSGTKSKSKSTAGHALGGVFNREHVARFAEGNKAEAIIPLENDTAMQPFVEAVSNGIVQSLAPLMSTMTSKISGGEGSTNLQPLLVGTLVADERGLKELNRKMKIINATEIARTGGNN